MPNKLSRLLTAEELIMLYNQPILSDSERAEYFTFNDTEVMTLNQFQDMEYAIYFAICLVFFKIKQTFVPFRYQDVTKERRRVMQRYFPNKASPKALPKKRNTIARIENTVLSLCHYQRYAGSVKINLLKKLQKQASLFPRQRKLCQECLELFKKNHVAIPSYTSIQDAVSQAWSESLPPEGGSFVNACKADESLKANDSQLKNYPPCDASFDFLCILASPFHLNFLL